nr:MAG: putative capsid protein [Arizlama virus]
MESQSNLIARRVTNAIKKRSFSTTRNRFLAAKTSNIQRRMALVAAARTVPPGLRSGGFMGPGFRRPEWKFADVAAATYAMISGGGVVTLINGVAEGSDFNERVGRRLTMGSIQIRGMITPVDNTVIDQVVRYMIVYDKQSNGAAPTIVDILTDNTPYGFKNLNNRARFIILKDEMFTLGARDTTATSSFSSAVPHAIEYYRRFRLGVEFKGATAAIGDIATGALFLVTSGSGAAATGANMIVSCRIMFTDA